MERNDRRRADALDRYWDAVQRGERPSPSGQIDEFAAAVVARVNEGHTRPYIDAYQRSVRLRVLEPVAPLGQPAPSIARPKFRRPDEEPERPAWRSRLVPLAAVLALLLIAAAGYLAFGRDDGENRTTIPAAVASPTPEPPKTETVLTVTIPAEDLPSGDFLSSGFAFFTVPVGNRSTWTPSCCPGPMVESVVEGTYSVRAEEPIKVVRSDGTVEAIPAGTEVTLAAGDSLVSRNETTVEAWNSGTVPVLLMNWVYNDDNGFYGHNLPGWAAGYADVQVDFDRPVGPATLTIERVPLPDGSATFAPNPGEMLFVLAYPEDDGYRAFRSDGSVEVGSAPGSEVVAYVLRVESAATTGSPIAGSPMASPVP